MKKEQNSQGKMEEKSSGSTRLDVCHYGPSPRGTESIVIQLSNKRSYYEDIFAVECRRSGLMYEVVQTPEARLLREGSPERVASFFRRSNALKLMAGMAYGVAICTDQVEGGFDRIKSLEYDLAGFDFPSLDK